MTGTYKSVRTATHRSPTLLASRSEGAWRVSNTLNAETANEIAYRRKEQQLLHGSSRNSGCDYASGPPLCQNSKNGRDHPGQSAGRECLRCVDFDGRDSEFGCGWKIGSAENGPDCAPIDVVL